MSARLVIPLVLLVGCEPPPPPDPAPPPVVAPPPAASAWRDRDGSALIAVDDPEIAADLRAATERARESAGRARLVWRQAGEDERSRWAIKWAAATEAGGSEHVWVRPLVWTEHRIEGVLASPPQRPLLCGAAAGDPVAFSADELTDWVHFLDLAPGGPRDGGYTIDVLETAFGDA